jgi:hypothetical protein
MRMQAKARRLRDDAKRLSKSRSVIAHFVTPIVSGRPPVVKPQVCFRLTMR